MSNTSHRLIKYSADLHSDNSIDPISRHSFDSGESVVFCGMKNSLISLQSLDANDYICPFCLKKLNELRKLRVFLCHASQDKPAVRDLYHRLNKEGWIDPWLDEEKLTFGQHWTSAIEDALDKADVVVIFLSRNSVQKEGFVQRELNYAWDISLEKPRGVIFLIPFRLDECEVPRHLRSRQWGDYFGEKKESTYTTLLRSLKERHQQKLHLEAEDNTDQNKEPETELKALESQAIRYELMGDFWNARKTWYAIKQIDHLFPRVDIKIRELEREVAEMARREMAERESAEKASYRKTKRQVSARDTIRKLLSKAIPSLRIIGVIGIIAALLWGGLQVLPQFVASMPTAKATTTQRPVANATSTKTFVIPSKTPKPNATPTKTRTAIPSSLPTEITDAKSVPMVLVPEGKFIMGSNTDAYYLDDDQKPAHNVFLDTFYIDKYEVTNSLYKACADAGVCTNPYKKSSYNGSSYYGSSESDNYPVIYVDWYQAKAYCEWRDARLPTEAEWEKAAQGTNTYESNQTVTTTYNGDIARVGSYPAGISTYGAYDMAGNVWEWVNDWYQSDYYITLGDNAVNPQGPDKGDSKVLRGGSWFPGGYAKGVFNESVGPIYNRYRDFPLRYYFDTGFRCAKDANP